MAADSPASQSTLMEAFEFDEHDLAANRQGLLSQRQKEMLESGMPLLKSRTGLRSLPWLLAVVIPLLVLSLVGLPGTARDILGHILDLPFFWLAVGIVSPSLPYLIIKSSRGRNSAKIAQIIQGMMKIGGFALIILLNVLLLVRLVSMEPNLTELKDQLASLPPQFLVIGVLFVVSFFVMIILLKVSQSGKLAAMERALESGCVEAMTGKMRVYSQRAISREISDNSYVSVPIPLILDFRVNRRRFVVPRMPTSEMYYAIEQGQVYTVYYIEHPSRPLILSLEKGEH